MQKVKDIEKKLNEVLVEYLEKQGYPSLAKIFKSNKYAKEGGLKIKQV